ncbi:MAG TPA: MinD/ParA family protein [Sedimenticola sp.]|nr:MinD/ParA family protein [Sedimenticola sp.]
MPYLSCNFLEASLDDHQTNLHMSAGTTNGEPASRVALRDKTQNTRARVIAITSGKGGVGKTNIAANLGIALTSRGRRVCVFDADTNLANIDILLGLTPAFTLEHLLDGAKAIEDILLDGPAGLHIVPAASGIAEFIDLGRDQQERLLAALKKLESDFDYLLIDTAAGISESVLGFLQAAPYTILAITPEPTSLTDSFSLIKVLKRLRFDHPIFVIVNMASSQDSASGTFKRFRDAVAKYLQIKVHYLGCILSDADLGNAVLRQKAVLLESPAGQASRCIQTISERLERALESAKSKDGFSDFWATLLQPFGDALTEAPLAATPLEEGGNPENIKQYLQAKDITEEQAEALLLELIQIWMERFGHPPPSLLDIIEQPAIPNGVAKSGHCATELEDAENRAAVKPPERESLEIQEAEVAGLRRAIHYARLLASSEHGR